MKNETLSVIELYEEIIEHIIVYLNTQKEQRIIRPPFEQEYLQQKKEKTIQNIKSLLAAVRNSLVNPISEQIPYKKSVPIKIKSQHAAEMKEIFMWLNPEYSYQEFLRQIKKNYKTQYRSEYEEIEVQRRVIKYLKNISPPVKKYNVTPFKTYHSLRNKSYCITCRRVITNKMVPRHNQSKLHKVKKPVYLRLTEKQAEQINKEYINCIRNSKMHLRHLLQNNTRKHVKNITITPYPVESKEPVEIKYTCALCNKIYRTQAHFIRHFSLKEHKKVLQSLGIKNTQDYEGLTTEKAIKERRALYYTSLY